MPDLRNSRAIDVINELRTYNVEVFVHDPVPSANDAQHEYGIQLRPWDALPVAEAMVVAVTHRCFREMDAAQLASKIVPKGCFIDVKSAFDTNALRALGLCLWRL